jgi:pimeloyl-ACP methyl ester carboxylesterase/nucleoside-diphosphate-sugar epimerase
VTDHAVVTGATGLIGRWLVPELTRRGDEVTAIVRDADRRRADYLAWVAAHGGDADRVTVVEGDLARDGLGLDGDDAARARGATMIFHLGAANAMGLDPALAIEINERGSERVVALATEAPALRRLVVISGYRTAVVDPADAARQGPYEHSKVNADRRTRALAAAHALPLTMVNPSTVIGDSVTGETTMFWGFSDLVRDVFFGRIPAIPGDARHWLPLVTVDHLARFLATVPALDTAPLADYFVLDDQTPDLATLVEQIASRLGVSAGRRRVPMPLARGMMRATGRRTQAEAMSFIARDRYDVGPAARAARRAGLIAPNIERAIEISIDYLIATRFGAVPAARGQMVRIAGVPTFVAGPVREARVVLLHGFPLDGATWDAVAAELDVPTVRPDVAGLGRSSAHPVARPDWVAALVAGVDEPAVLVAHSYGAAFALDAAIHHPDRVRSLILLSPYFLQARAPVYFRCAVLGRLAIAGMGQDRMTAAVGDEPYASLLYQTLDRAGGRTQLARGIATADHVRGELTARLAQLRIPITLIIGADEPLRTAPPPTARVVVIGNGHNPQHEDPRAVAAIIAEHVRADPARAADHGQVANWPAPARVTSSPSAIPVSSTTWPR